MPKLRHYDHCGTARFVTFTCYRRHRYLTTLPVRQILLEGITYLRAARKIRILGWVFMPEHIHLVLLPPDDISLGEAIGRFKGWTARQILRRANAHDMVLHRGDGKPALWQRHFYDYNCRTTEGVRQKIEYCHKNPVTRGLVDRESAWPWSSYNWYQGEGQMVLEIDGMEL